MGLLTDFSRLPSQIQPAFHPHMHTSEMSISRLNFMPERSDWLIGVRFMGLSRAVWNPIGDLRDPVAAFAR